MPPDADIPDKVMGHDHGHKSMDSHDKSISRSEDSKESSESTGNSSEDSNSSEERMFTDSPTVVQTTAAMTTFTSGDKSEFTSEPHTHRPTVMETTPLPATVPDVTTHFTEEITTPAPVTPNRGDV